MIIDSHCHLNFPQLDGDLEGVRSRAKAAGVDLMLTIGTKLREFDRVREIAEAAPEVYCSVGVHPHEAEQERINTAQPLVTISQHPKVVGIGETGFDFYYDNAPRDAQEEVFRLHVEACQETGLPIIIHTRDADRETGDLLTEAYKEKPFGGVLHCFTGGWELASRAIDIGFYVSFSGILTFKNSQAIRDVAAQVPMDRLLVETDAPFLAPVPHRGQTNEPSYVIHTLGCLAEVKGVSTEEMARQTTENFFRLFSKVERPQ